MTFQPGVPTGSVPLNQDYLNIQGNFTSLNTQFLVDHIPLTNGSQNGYHKSIHLVPQATPGNVSGVGQIYSKTVNDGINTDQQLFFQTGTGNRNIQFTRNFLPSVSGGNGSTFLPGGFILQWGSTTAVASSGGNTINFNFPFPNAVFSVQPTVVTSDNSTIRFSLLNNASTSSFTTTQTNTSKFTNLYWIAIGN